MDLGPDKKFLKKQKKKIYFWDPAYVLIGSIQIELLTAYQNIIYWL